MFGRRHPSNLNKTSSTDHGIRFLLHLADGAMFRCHCPSPLSSMSCLGLELLFLFESIMKGDLSPEGVSVLGVTVQGGLCPGGGGVPALPPPPPPTVDRVTNRCKDITFFAAGNNLNIHRQNSALMFSYTVRMRQRFTFFHLCRC